MRRTLAVLAAAALAALLSACGTNNILVEFFTPTMTPVASATPTATPTKVQTAAPTEASSVFGAVPRKSQPQPVPMPRLGGIRRAAGTGQGKGKG